MAAILFELVPGVLNAIEFDATLSLVPTMSAEATEHPVEEGAALSDHVKPNLTRVQLEGLITNTPINSSTVEIVTKAGVYKTVAPLRGRNEALRIEGRDSQGNPITGVERQRWAKGADVKGGNLPAIPNKVPLVGGLSTPAQLEPLVQPSPITVTPARREADRLGATQVTLQFDERVDRVVAVFDILERLNQEGVQVRLLTDHKEYPSMLISSLSAPQKAEDALVFSMELKAVKFASVVTTKIRAKKTAEKRAQVEVSAGSQTTVDLFEGLNREELRSLWKRLLAPTG